MPGSSLTSELWLCIYVLELIKMTLKHNILKILFYPSESSFF